MNPGAVSGSGAGVGAERPPPRRATSRRALAWLRIHPAVAVIAGACAELFHQIMHTGLAGDVYFHWAAGTWMLDHHSVIRHDVFSYTVNGRPWLADEWGFEVVLAWLVRTIGSVSFWLVSAGSCSLALVFGSATWRRSGAGWLWTAVLSCLATAGMLIGLSVRPQDPSYMFFAAELLLLGLAHKNTRWLIALPPLLLIWANVHGSFLLGLGVIFLEVIWSVSPELKGRLQVCRRLPTRAIGVTAVVSLAATIVNPHGIALLKYALHVSSSSELSSLIQEWQSPNFHDVLVLALVVVPLIWLIGTLGFSNRTLALEDVVIAAVLLVAALHAVRFLPYLVIAWCAVLARATPLKSESIRPTLLSLPLAVVLCAALLGGSHTPAGAPQRGGGVLGMPVDAAAFIQHQQGHTFATYWWGDYLMHLRVPVFVDGRTDLYFGTGVLSTYVDVSQVLVNPDSVFRRWDVRWILWNRGSALSVFLSQDPRWKRVLTSGNAIVYEHLGTW